MIRNWYNQIPYPALKTKREITKYINRRYLQRYSTALSTFQYNISPKTSNPAFSKSDNSFKYSSYAIELMCRINVYIYLCAETTRTTYKLKRPWNKTPVVKVLVPPYTIPEMFGLNPNQLVQEIQNRQAKIDQIMTLSADLENRVRVTKPNWSSKDATLKNYYSRRA